MTFFLQEEEECQISFTALMMSLPSRGVKHYAKMGTFLDKAFFIGY